MTDDAYSDHAVAVARLMRWLYEFAQGLGLDEFTACAFVIQVIDDMPADPDDGRLARAHDRMLIASA